MFDPFFAVFIFLIGAIVGSFLNVCIVRMPRDLSVVAPGSHCFSCRNPIAWCDNIPIISWFVLGGKCRHCGTRFSFRYPLVELLTACCFLGFYVYFGWSTKLAAYLVMMSCFIVSTFVDFEHRIIPDEISVGGMFAGMILSVFFIDLHSVGSQELLIGRIVMRLVVGICLMVHVIEFFWSRREFDREDGILLAIILGLVLVEAGMDVVLNAGSVHKTSMLGIHLLSADASIIGLLLGGGVIYAMGLLGDLIFRKESMGGGDVKLMALIGAFMGWKLAVLTFFVAPFFGALYGIIEKIRTKDSAIAYGPFIVMGALISLFYGDTIVAWIMGQYGVGPV